MTSAKSLLPFKVTYLCIPGIKSWISLGGLLLLPGLVFSHYITLHCLLILINVRIARVVKWEDLELELMCISIKVIYF